MYTVEVDGLQDCLYKIALLINRDGKSVHVRGMNTKELHPCFIQMNNPQDRTLLYPKRGNNPFASLAETMWVLSGSNRIDWLSKFLPRAKDYSDDGGKTWRAGYGPRLRRWDFPGGRSGDQIKFVQKQLIKDQSCRQAIISLWDPAREIPMQEIGTKDWPCSNWLHFLVRDGALDLTVVMRSNDFVWGFSSINVYEWTVLQEIMARSLGIKIGKYYHLSDSMHVYEQYYDKLDQLIDNYIPDFGILLPSYFEFGILPSACVGELRNSKIFLQTYFNNVETLCDNIEKKIVDFQCYNFIDLMQINRILVYYLLNKDNPDREKHQEFLDQLPFTDLKVAIDYWWQKNIFREKDTGIILVKECIKRCETKS